MRVVATLTFVIVLAAPGSSRGQESTDFVSREDGFRADGNDVRYQGYDDNDYPPPPRVGGTGAVITGGGPDPNVAPRGR